MKISKECISAIEKSIDAEVYKQRQQYNLLMKGAMMFINKQKKDPIDELIDIAKQSENAFPYAFPIQLA